MNEFPRQKLCELIAQYGHSLCDDPRRCEALLRDYCGQNRKEIFVLTGLRQNCRRDRVQKQFNRGFHLDLTSFPLRQEFQRFLPFRP